MLTLFSVSLITRTTIEMSKAFIIDDDPIHQKIAQIIFNKHQLFDEYTSYTEAIHALQYLVDHAADATLLPDVILLDLNMPGVNGWEFLDGYNKIRTQLVKHADIYIISSSVDQNDRQRAESFPYVKGFISKPISSALLINLLRPQQ